MPLRLPDGQQASNTKWLSTLKRRERRAPAPPTTSGCAAAILRSATSIPRWLVLCLKNQDHGFPHCGAHPSYSMKFSQKNWSQETAALNSGNARKGGVVLLQGRVKIFCRKNLTEFPVRTGRTESSLPFSHQSQEGLSAETPVPPIRNGSGSTTDAGEEPAKNVCRGSLVSAPPQPRFCPCTSTAPGTRASRPSGSAPTGTSPSSSKPTRSTTNPASWAFAAEKQSSDDE